MAGGGLLGLPVVLLLVVLLLGLLVLVVLLLVQMAAFRDTTMQCSIYLLSTANPHSHPHPLPDPHPRQARRGIHRPAGHLRL